jgi:hypothetical protein
VPRFEDNARTCALISRFLRRWRFAQILAVRCNRLLAGNPRSLHFLEVARLPTFVDGGLGRTVQPDDGENPLPGTVASQLASFPCGAFGPRRGRCFRRHSVTACRENRVKGKAGRWRGQTHSQPRKASRTRSRRPGCWPADSSDSCCHPTGGARTIGKGDHVSGALARCFREHSRADRIIVCEEPDPGVEGEIPPGDILSRKVQRRARTGRGHVVDGIDPAPV